MKRYNIKIMEMETGDVVYEEELKVVRLDTGVVYIDNLIHATFCDIETAIENREKKDAKV